MSSIVHQHEAYPVIRLADDIDDVRALNGVGVEYILVADTLVGSQHARS